jgi:hypothetical protein
MQNMQNMQMITKYAVCAEYAFKCAKYAHTHTHSIYTYPFPI